MLRHSIEARAIYPDLCMLSCRGLFCYSLTGILKMVDLGSKGRFQQEWNLLEWDGRICYLEGEDPE